MVFSSTIFIFLFLPIVLCLHSVLKDQYRNLFLLFASLFFYAWGEQILVLLMIGSVCLNYIVGNLIEFYQRQGREKVAKWVLGSGVAINLLILGYYKYIHFLVEILTDLGFTINADLSGITLPIGISFFTFQGISYLIDVHRKTVESQKSLINLGMYISLFPQLIAGPIVRYADITKEIESRKITTDLFKEGISRFIIGLSKKIFIANNVGLIADLVFAIPANDLPTSLTWIGILCYTLQIYYDFSGYSDMAIGLGKMFGFNFKENFEHPYCSKSVREFWRRWHISLSSWFRDYLYIPLGGNRKGNYRTYINLILVFFATGLWHGASWNFIVWGFFHGFFLIAEKITPFQLPAKLQFLKRVYLLFVVMIGWVFFRAENLTYALDYMAKMFSFVGGEMSDNSPFESLDVWKYIAIGLGILFSIPLRQFIEEKIKTFTGNSAWFVLFKELLYLLVFVCAIIELAQATYNPFIYFRF
ncbi:MBOAT family O-acyltransferase [Aureispira anguillae]|uniref:MBOAT family protein n=1 Tax=Aureispira anguillae TaxID=2864201 RepID=A0A915YCE1_9BACT|nr:MBOAT family O-acyltransferase [Aureispira anguillae]BDS10503.1 MBOAT family protein [Aureispira anguillae]